LKNFATFGNFLKKEKVHEKDWAVNFVLFISFYLELAKQTWSWCLPWRSNWDNREISFIKDKFRRSFICMAIQ